MRTTPSIAALIQLMWFQNDLAAIPVVLVGVTSFIPTRQQEAAAGKQQAGTRGNQVPGSSRRRNVVKTTYKRRMKRRWNQTLATPGPEWAAPIPAAPAELSSRKINPWAKEKASTQPARHDRSSQWHRWIQTTTMQIPQVGVDSETHRHRNKTQEKCAKNARGRLCLGGRHDFLR